MEKIGLYVHIPYCLKKCNYCSFVSYCNRDDTMSDYLIALCNEIKKKSRTYRYRKVDTIFIGGGTPSRMISGGIATIIKELKNAFFVDEDAEITIESNPNSVTYEKALEWKNAGVNRVSVGLQCSNDKVLRAVGRMHTKSDYYDAMHILHEVGFTNINNDVIFGLPTQKLTDVKNTLNTVIRQNVTHISAYSLILEENTVLSQQVESGEYKLPKEEKVLSMYNYILSTLEANGYHRYEVSNFCKDGYECKHNLNCWEYKEYVGFGVASHSFVGDTRSYNTSSLDTYIDNMKKGLDVTEVTEQVTIKDHIEEYIMLGLRTKNGVSFSYLKERFGYDLFTKKQDVINKYLGLKMLVVSDGRLCATSDGYFVLNKIILDLVY